MCLATTHAVSQTLQNPRHMCLSQGSPDAPSTVPSHRHPNTTVVMSEESPLENCQTLAIIVSYNSVNHLPSSRRDLRFPLLHFSPQQTPLLVVLSVTHSGRTAPPHPVLSRPTTPLSVLPGGAPTEQHLLFSLSLFPAHTPPLPAAHCLSPRDQPDCFPDPGGCGTPTPCMPFCSANLGSGFQGYLEMQTQETHRNTDYQRISPRVPSMGIGKFPDPKF